jgi:hypothetical protein
MKLWREANQKPPLGAILNPDCALNRGKVGCWLFNEGAGARYQNIADARIFGSPVDPGTPWLPLGVLLDSNYRGINTGLPSNVLTPNNTPGYTLMVSLIPSDVTNDKRILTVRTSAASKYALVGGRVSGKTSSFMRNAAVGLIQLDSTDAYTINVSHQILAVAREGYGALFLDGKFQAESATVSAEQTFAGDASVVVTGDNAGNQWPYGIFQHCVIIARALSASEALALYREPYGLDQYLVPGLPVFYSIPAGAGAAWFAARNQAIIDGSPFGGLTV